MSRSPSLSKSRATALLAPYNGVKPGFSEVVFAVVQINPYAVVVFVDGRIIPVVTIGQQNILKTIFVKINQFKIDWTRTRARNAERFFL